MEIELPLVIEKRAVEESLFPVRLHPQHESLQEQLHSWAASTLGPAYADEHQVASLGSCYWPNTIAKPRRRILKLLKCLYWLFLVDDMVANSCKDPSRQVNAFHAEQIGNTLLHAIFGCAAQPHYLPFQEALPRVILTALQMLSELRDDGMSPTQQARLQSQITTFLQSLGKEQLLNNAMAPSLEQYNAFNTLPRGTSIVVLLAEYSLGIELSKEALASPLVKELQAASCDLLNWVNDIFSFERELADKDHFMNILYVLHFRNNNGGPSRVPFDAAVSEAWEMIQRRQRDCARLTNEILLSPHLLASSPGLDSYAENLCLQASLNIALKPFRGNALRPLPRIAALNQFGRTSVGMLQAHVRPCQVSLQKFSYIQ